MTIQEFTSLSEAEQGRLLFLEGEFLQDRATSGERRQMLYGLYGFWVEVVYNRRENAIESMHPFADTRRLEPYLDNIALPDFLRGTGG
ncbi:hypothetical protein V9K67_21385 [Paraflavisolibacter sp. H34]|uniref:hypothetical protein n=1 Tax=Huijunlia imazamoxiresistens TaxID=3127457 RepID=UPI00301B193E